MISYLRGKIIAKEEGFVILDAGGVGYKIFVSSREIKVKVSGETSFFCFFRPGKNSWDLYGLSSFEKLKFFEFLIKIPGIGPKAALDISSLFSLETIKGAIEENDEKALRSLFAIGKKKAQAIIFEISRKLKNRPGDDSETEEAVRALSKLGFSRKEILKSLPEKSETAEEKIKGALKVLGKRQ